MNNKSLLRSVLSIASVTLFALANYPATTLAAVEAAKVNGTVISADLLNARYQEQVRVTGPSQTNKKEVLDGMIKREVAVQAAKKMKLDQEPDIQDRINSVLFFAYIEKTLGSQFDKLGVSDSEAKSWYSKNPEIRTSHIFLSLTPFSTPEELKAAQNKMNEISKEIKSGKASFAEAAQKYSEDPSGPMGGDLDYRTRDRLDPAYYEAAVKLGKVGATSGIIRTTYGLHLIRLTGKRSWLEADRTRIKRLILEEKRDSIVARHLDQLKGKAQISINKAAL